MVINVLFKVLLSWIFTINVFKYLYNLFLAYNQWMENNGGVIINIIADMFKGFPTMR